MSNKMSATGAGQLELSGSCCLRQIVLLLLSLSIPISRTHNNNNNNDNKPVHLVQATPQTQQQQQIPKILLPDLPAEHYQFWLKNNPRALAEYKKICADYGSMRKGAIKLELLEELHANLTIESENYFTDISSSKSSALNVICSKIDIASKSCWGYENNCQIIHLMPECYGSSMGQAKTEQEQKISWFSRADFGYIMDRRKEIARFCSPDRYSNDSVKSSLECTKYFRTCRAENLMMKFDNLPKSGSLITNQPVASVISKGNVGGWNCDLQLKRIQEENGQRGVLQSWFNELKDYNKLSGSGEEACDIIIEKQAYVMKLDSPFNMYHYFCNFLNLYATLHLHNRFSSDNQIIIWDNQLPKSNFELMWSAFSRNKPMSLADFGQGKRVCFKKVIFSLLPRMIDGLYYNTPLIPGCFKSGLFDAFNKHVLYKLKIEQQYDLEAYQKDENKLIRVTIISRSTAHRRILNEPELEAAIISNRSQVDYRVNLVDFSKLDLREQLKISQNTDILIGVHGAGLTNCLFLPNWATLLELNDCNDKCYHDLARLRGVNYFSSNRKHVISQRLTLDDRVELEKLTKSNLVDHEKFSNYKILIPEFMETFQMAVDRVRKNRVKYFDDDNLAKKAKESEQPEGETLEIKTKEQVTTEQPKHIEL